MAKAKSKDGFDLFGVLNRLGRKQRNYTDDEIKAIQPLVVMRWLSGTSSQFQVFTLNEFVNQYVFDLQKHKELLINLMTATGTGRSTRYSWLKRKVTKPKQKKVVEVIAKYHGYSDRRAIEVVDILEPSVIISYAEELGYQKDFMKELKKEIKSL